MKRSVLLTLLTLAAAILTLVVSNDSTSASVQHGFRIKEYELFHDVLHPLQHEALPKGDFERIRSMASELVARGKAIVKLGTPEAPRDARQKFTKVRKEFERALAAFKADARKGSDSRLNKSFTAVHDSFEQLADLVPTVYPMGDPPSVSVDCPSTKPEAGTALTLTASTQAEEAFFTWTVDGGKIRTGQGTPSVTIDTTGLAGKIISVRVEINDRFGFAVVTECKVQLAQATTIEGTSRVHGF